MPHLAVLLLLSLSSPATAPARGDVDPVIARVVAGLQAVEGQAGDAMRVTGARGEGRTLILDIELAATMPEQIRPQMVAAMTAAALCSEERSAAFFGDGRVLRVAVVRAGRPLGSATIDRCPGPIGEGLSAGTYASGMQSIVGMETGGMKVVSIRAEGNSLVVTVDVVSGPMGGAAAATTFVADFCRRPEVQAAFFDRGLRLRVDTTVRGRDRLTGAPIASCPGR
jgi:hypothetical protein